MEIIEQQNKRLIQALCNSEINFVSDLYDYEEFNSEQFYLKFNAEALALTRDGSRWSQLVKHDKGSFAMFSVHFNGIDNVNGFVGWFASFLKEKLGIGLIVFVGSNSLKNGVYDYYGVPKESIVDVQREITLLEEAIYSTNVIEQCNS